MADIRPFLCIRPAEGKAAAIAALPYDVYNRREAKAETEKNPDSFLKIDRAETQFDDSVDTYDECVYKKAHDILWGMVSNGDFIREEKPCYYIYELTMEGRVQTGLVACASIDNYETGVIKKHENTRAEKEADRIRHVDACSAQTGPIFLAYRANAVIREVVGRVKEGVALYDFTSEDHIRHRVFRIDSMDDIARIKEAFAGIGEIYIADGHHRAASAVKTGKMRRQQHPDYTGEEEFNYFLSVLFPDEELMIMDYNRVVKDLGQDTPDAFLEKVRRIFDVAELGQAARPQQKGQVCMYLAGKWYQLLVKEGDQSSDPVEGLDVSLLQKLLLEPVLGILDPKTDARIDFVGGIRGLGELERRVNEDCAVAFAMYPTSIGELFAVADAGKLMPPKSTWFEPKLRSGLFIHEI
ncbi:MAG: DUF1015 family protein [Eubacterium sp.]|jgi:uncharacterized protein (DUF1015 family)|nr:DUF1015 family protein [Eubacterium sp.]NBI87966.1 DUF1015 domain-containing protein [Lachnospiraceae bacterium]